MFEVEDVGSTNILRRTQPLADDLKNICVQKVDVIKKSKK